MSLRGVSLWVGVLFEIGDSLVLTWFRSFGCGDLNAETLFRRVLSFFVFPSVMSFTQKHCSALFHSFIIPSVVSFTQKHCSVLFHPFGFPSVMSFTYFYNIISSFVHSISKPLTWTIVTLPSTETSNPACNYLKSSELKIGSGQYKYRSSWRSGSLITNTIDKIKQIRYQIILI